ncbi:hypothetical protein EJ06DRAFT_404233 [Trichodelitschia bisporula]|uniref:Uncharacterized protein n=1 Tax=Trichodelitschia bisporula TaxID=703511 RepID=A0A6G1HXG9_9PEZI|nr:hypothetical protein EJ06DRAFT_404233 [Trichodelitschia bisporula]
MRQNNPHPAASSMPHPLSDRSNSSESSTLDIIPPPLRPPDGLSPPEQPLITTTCSTPTVDLTTSEADTCLPLASKRKAQAASPTATVKSGGNTRADTENNSQQPRAHDAAEPASVTVRFINNPNGTPLSTIVERCSSATLQAQPVGAAPAPAPAPAPASASASASASAGAPAPPTSGPSSKAKAKNMLLFPPVDSTKRQLGQPRKLISRSADEDAPAPGKQTTGDESMCASETNQSSFLSADLTPMQGFGRPLSPEYPPLVRTKTPPGASRWPGDIPVIRVQQQHAQEKQQRRSRRRSILRPILSLLRGGAQAEPSEQGTEHQLTTVRTANTVWRPPPSGYTYRHGMKNHPFHNAPISQPMASNQSQGSSSETACEPQPIPEAPGRDTEHPQHEACAITRLDAEVEVATSSNMLDGPLSGTDSTPISNVRIAHETRRASRRRTAPRVPFYRGVSKPSASYRSEAVGGRARISGPSAGNGTSSDNSEYTGQQRMAYTMRSAALPILLPIAAAEGIVRPYRFASVESEHEMARPVLTNPPPVLGGGSAARKPIQRHDRGKAEVEKNNESRRLAVVSMVLGCCGRNKLREDVRGERTA